MDKIGGQIYVSSLDNGFGLAAQEPWIQHATVKENILFGQPFDVDKYSAVVDACALEEDLLMLPAGDETEVGENGVTLSGGQKARVALARAVYQDKDVYLLDDPLAAVDAHVAAHLFQHCILGLLREKTVILCTHHTKYLKAADHVIVMQNGRIIHQGLPSEILSKETLMSQISRDFKDVDDDSDLDLETEPEENTTKNVEEDGGLVSEEEKDEGAVKLHVYGSYWLSFGHCLAISILLSLLLMQASRNLSDWWLAYWISHSKTRNDRNITIASRGSAISYSSPITNYTSHGIHIVKNSVTFYLIVYAGFAVSNTIFTLFRAFLFAYGGVKAARVLHQRLLATILAAPVSFFDATPIGRIVNRFSSDMYSIDDSLPFILNIFLAQAYGVAGTIAITCYGLPWFAVLLLPLVLIYYYIQNYYRRTSRTTTVEPQAMAAAQWLNLRLQFLGVAMVTGVAFIAVLEHHFGTVDPGLVGLAISYALSVTDRLSGMVTSFTETEKQMVSVERAVQYIEDIPSEQSGNTKIGIVGRTGSGKSSLFLVLFRMVKIQEGVVIVDGVVVASLPLEAFRSRLAIIPQDPFLFSGSVRSNMDPWSQYSDADLWTMLQRCHMNTAVRDLGGLDADVGERGRNFSVGQRQLICLARALLSRAKRKSAKGKEKKLKRKEEIAKINASQAVVDAANDVVDPFKPFAAFKKYTRNGLDLHLNCQRVTKMSVDEVQWAFDLTKCNMEALYEESDWGWNDKKKMEEMSEDKAWYLIVKENGGQAVALSHFRFDLDENMEEVLYCYEVQVDPALHHKGLGKFLMQILELIGHKAQMKKVVLTVFTDNNVAVNFFKNCLNGSLSVNQPSSNAHNPINKDVDAHERVDTHGTSSSTNSNIVTTQLIDIVKNLVENQNYSKLPSPEPGIFSGDLLHYPIWIQAFETLIENKTTRPNERIHFLRKYVAGEAKEAIDGLLLLKCDDAYQKAKEMLSKRFGDPFAIATAYRQKLESWPKIQNSDVKGLRKFTDFLAHCEKAMDGISSLRVLDDDQENRKMAAKLPKWITNRWAREVYQYKEEIGMFPSFKKFVKFLIKESDIANDPVFSAQNQELPLSNKPKDTLKPFKVATQRNQIPRPEAARQWTHTERIAEKLNMPYREYIDVGLLIGLDCTRALIPREVIAGDGNNPYALKTDLGWGIIGKYNDAASDNDEEDNIGVSHRIISCEVTNPQASCYLSRRTKTKEVLNPLQMENGIVQRSDGHYQMPLPFREEIPNLPNNKALASHHRLQKLQQRMAHDDKYYSMYKAAMDEVIEKGYAEKVPVSKKVTEDGKVWYIPHHGVFHPKKPEKLRVVYDCSARYKGESLNEHLLAGPDLTNNLVGVLCRFRQEPFAFIGDIEGMFHQFKVEEEHRDFLRFLWWDNGNLQGTPDEYRMTVHLFGAKSSPGCSNYGLKKIADDYEDEFGSKVADFIRNDFYVDDGLKSLPTEEQAISVGDQTIIEGLCHRAGWMVTIGTSGDGWYHGASHYPLVSDGEIGDLVTLWHIAYITRLCHRSGWMVTIDFSYDVKHPVILPRKGHVTELLITFHHERIKHQGRGITLNELRSSGYWIIGGSSAVGRYITNCVTCSKLRSKTEDQKMADLPNDRLQPAPPFTFCAVDYFGPWYIKEGRKELKRYGVLFTCMACRAIHLETANSLDTSSFINALRRFISRRGPIRQLRSDRGTNFVGAKKELQEAVAQLDQTKIQEFLLKRNCDWFKFEMNVTSSSHMGGSWERQIRTVRSVLSALLEENGRQLDDESLRTLMCETESVVNSRPLSVENLNSPNGPEPLTPNHLLTILEFTLLTLENTDGSRRITYVPPMHYGFNRSNSCTNTGTTTCSYHGAH
ncbi:hypothetical protein QZH41_005748 [Actinostola sp. cb2023]|nr:hypothetical protein QZH41_005748 [Actinostola sp. cb2023]